jgi:hypothetical protein
MRAPGPLSAEHLRAIGEARARAKKVRRAVGVAIGLWYRAIHAHNAAVGSHLHEAWVLLRGVEALVGRRASAQLEIHKKGARGEARRASGGACDAAPGR